ncbi:Thp1p [Kluyveromyces lactis]|uniref:KLLA0D03674p n=1 Tax=Kluyveromyces lactis (strain ATCC 8585 / CBS 2359 / DSM 70799 / NBRC 1267 / NRRL Y-1140 / WM37) TaxID=284590 RepID=Q6CS61_KLULA|nr:uncharacterized protein KLLA0_D03674g [Kluyveromyces lactis]CAH00324.1 KLLA0D03674p [Kluyveromyces lactis]|eukprot:XP_453228.1 uncharacterized protein KLLA0_D03674g [Kluyveromyces lactis]
MDHFFGALKAGDFSVLDINIERNGQLILELQQFLRSNDSIDLETLINSHSLYENRWTRFNNLVSSFLGYCKELNPYSLWESSFSVFQYYQDLNTCLTNETTMYPIDSLVPLFTATTELVIPMAIRLDANHKIIGTRQHQFLTHIASIISKLFNSIKARVDDDKVEFDHLSGKQKVLLYISNKLNMIYFKINSPSSCANIFKNLKPKSNIYSFNQYPLTERIQYRYYLGRYYLLNHRMVNAFHQLNQCYELLATLPDSIAKQNNRRRLLKFLVPCGIIISKLPDFNKLSQWDPILAQKYTALVIAVKNGNLNRVNFWLYENESWLKSSKLLIVLLEKLPIITFRSLLRSIFLYYCIPRNSNKLPYSVIRPILAKSIGLYPPEMPSIYKDNYTAESLENILVTLSIQQLWKGNVFPSLQVCVTMKTNDISVIFPNINEKIVSRFSLNQEDSWLDK